MALKSQLCINYASSSPLLISKQLTVAVTTVVRTALLAAHAVLAVGIELRAVAKEEADKLGLVEGVPAAVGIALANAKALWFGLGLGILNKFSL